ncbi:Hypothetical protein XFF4834R_chr14250 [Xanthomonas citri pv. fuscans]|nr:Hypothetical protein XFF4834R_chr14250 [Xanthomonas citri pv. fuscans]
MSCGHPNFCAMVSPHAHAAMERTLMNARTSDMPRDR